MKLPLRDFNHIPLDCTVLVRKTLPLPEVTLDSGPSSRDFLNTAWFESRWVVGNCKHYGHTIPRHTWEMFQLARWALFNTAPDTRIHNEPR